MLISEFLLRTNRMVIHAEKYLESVLLATLIANSGIFLAACR